MDWVNLHPTRENRRTRQSSSNRSISNHEHLRLLGIFGEVSLLDPDGDEDDAAEEDREADDDAVAIGLGEELDSHLLRNVVFLAEYGHQNKKPPSEVDRYIQSRIHSTIIFSPTKATSHMVCRQDSMVSSPRLARKIHRTTRAQRETECWNGRHVRYCRSHCKKPA